MKKILVIGGTGTIGKVVSDELKKHYEVVVAGHDHGDIQIDIENLSSIQSMYEKLGKLDGVIATTGRVHFGEFEKMGEKEFSIGLQSKLMGQVNLVMSGLKYINDGGSFTLTSGILSKHPIRFGASASLVNGALEGFVLGAACEMPRGIRINIVSPTVIKESMEKYEKYFLGFEPVSAAKAAQAYLRSVSGVETGQVFPVGW